MFKTLKMMKAKTDLCYICDGVSQKPKINFKCIHFRIRINTKSDKTRTGNIENMSKHPRAFSKTPSALN
jgi:hypothetical protein